MSIELSIICPVKNMEGRLGNLRSWVSSCAPQIQIILIADSCTDKTHEELLDLKNSLDHLQILVIEGQYGSPGSARNAGLVLAQGNWISFWDSDDLGYPELLLESLEGTVPESSEVVISGYEIRSDEKFIQRWLGLNENIKTSLNDVALEPGIWRFCFRNSIILATNFSHHHMGEDQLFLVQLNLESRNIFLLDAIIYTYYKNVENQLTSSKEGLSDLRPVINELAEYMRKSDNNSQFGRIIYTRILITLLIRGRSSHIFFASRYLLLEFRRDPSNFLKSCAIILRGSN